MRKCVTIATMPSEDLTHT